MQETPNQYPQNPQQQWQQQNTNWGSSPQWQQHEPLPSQHQQQTPYPAEYQPLIPPSPKKKSHKRLWLILAAVVLVLAVMIGIASQSQNQQSASTSQATQNPTLQSTSRPTPKPTVQPTKGLAVTHGTPFIGGPISDFFGKYGSPTNTNGNDAFWSLNSDESLTIDARDTGGGRVGYLAIVTPDNWSQQHIQSFALGFAPQEYTLDQTSIPYNASGLYVYDSPSIKFALHLSQGSCYMNTLP